MQMKNNKILNVLFLTMLLLMASPSVKAQTLSEEDKEELQIRTKQKLEDLLGHLSTIASRSVTADLKEKKVKVYVEREEVEMPDDEVQVIWLVLLGDIYVVNTR